MMKLEFLIILILYVNVNVVLSSQDLVCSNRNADYATKMKNWVVPDKEFDPRVSHDRLRFQRAKLLNDVMLNKFERHILVDLGARDPMGADSFLKFYLHGQVSRYDIYSFECDPYYHEIIKQRRNSFPPHTINLVTNAAWIINGTQTFSGHMGSLTALHQRNDLKFEEKTKPYTVNTIDFSNWIQRNIHENDFVVVKMDIEGAEFQILDHLIIKGTICLIDELYVEIHFNRFQSTRPGRQNRNTTWTDVKAIGDRLSKAGIYYHLWF